MTNNCIEAIDKQAIFNEFSSKFISTIAASGSDFSNNKGGTRDGWLLIEALNQFDNDWSKTYLYYLKALELEDPKKLIEKLKGKVHLFRDSQNKWRVAVIKTETNCDVMNLIDSAIKRKNYKLNSNRRHAFSDYSHRKLASTYQNHITLPQFNYGYHQFNFGYHQFNYTRKQLTDILDQLPPLQESNTIDLQYDEIDDVQHEHQVQQECYLEVSQDNIDALSTTTTESNSRKTPPFLNETRLVNLSATKKLRFLPQYFQKIYADKEFFLSKKKNGVKSSNSSFSSSTSSSENLIPQLCYEFSQLKIFD